MKSIKKFNNETLTLQTLAILTIIIIIFAFGLYIGVYWSPLTKEQLKRELALNKICKEQYGEQFRFITVDDLDLNIKCGNRYMSIMKDLKVK